MSADEMGKIIHKGGQNLITNLIDNICGSISVIDENLNILFWNQALEKLTGIESKSAVNNKCQRNLLIQGSDEKLQICFKACPVLQSFKDKVIRSYKVYILHKEGFRIPAIMKVMPVNNKIDSLNAAIIGFYDSSPKLNMPHPPEELKNMNMLDSLTGIGNEKYIKMNLGYRLDEKKKYGFQVGLLFCILDNMESIEDAYGTVVKDKFINMIGNTISKNIRYFEFVGRWNENSFLIILSHVNHSKLDLIGNKLRLLSEKSSMQIRDTLIHTTISIGGVFADSSSTVESLIEKSAKLADLSQKSGKNRVTLDPGLL